MSISVYVYDKDDGDVVNFMYFLAGINNYTISAQINNTKASTINFTVQYVPSANDNPSLELVEFIV